MTLLGQPQVKGNRLIILLRLQVAVLGVLNWGVTLDRQVCVPTMERWMEGMFRRICFKKLIKESIFDELLAMPNNFADKLLIN